MSFGCVLLALVKGQTGYDFGAVKVGAFGVLIRTSLVTFLGFQMYYFRVQKVPILDQKVLLFCVNKSTNLGSNFGSKNGPVLASKNLDKNDNFRVQKG